MKKVSTPILGETTIEDFIPKLIKFGEQARLLKQHYPSNLKIVGKVKK